MNRQPEIKVGDRIYYTGDMANQEAYGTVTKIEHGRFGSSCDITTDDGREMLGTYLVGIAMTYNGPSGYRFVTEKAYREWRNAMLARYAKSA